MKLNVSIKEEMDEVIRVKEESLDDMTTLANATVCSMQQVESYNDQSLSVKDELLLEDDWFLDSATAQPASPSFSLKGETCECAGNCDDCQTRVKSNGDIKEEIDDEVIRVKAEPIDATMTLANATDSNEVSHQIDIQLDSYCKQLLPVKEELQPEDVSLDIPASSPVSPLFAIKRETCECDDEHCEDCLEAEQSERIPGNVPSSVSCSGDDSSNEPSNSKWVESRDAEEVTVAEPGTVFVAPAIDSCATTSARSPPCPECGKTFPRNSKLTSHLRVHTGERPYVCGQCPKAFTQLGHLKQHQLTHSNERKYVCAQCPKAFNQLGHLTRHQLTHQAVRSRPFRCTAEGCGKDFPRKGELTVHLGRHKEEKPHKCDNCGKAFTAKAELTVHYRKHTGERPYRCPLCPKAFSTSSNAKSHQRTAHPTER